MQSWLDGRAEEMVALLEALVRVPTENPPGRELGRCARLLCDALARLDFSPELIELAPAGGLEGAAIVRGSVGDGPEVVYYHGHFDVVPAQSPSQFEPVRRDGKVIGRGTADMKGGLVSMLYGAAAARALGLLDGRRIVFHLVCDEETGSTAGSGHLRDAGLIDPEAVAMLTAEPTGGVIWHAARGAITLRVRTSGREAHVGYVHEGVNAFEHMIRIAAPLTALSPTSCSRSARAFRSRARRRRVRCSWSAGRPAPVPVSTSCPGRRGSRSIGGSTPRRSSTRSSRD